MTDIVTLLSAREQPFSLQGLAKSIGAHWHHFPIDGGHIDTLKSVDLGSLFALIDEIEGRDENAVIYLHCSAGLHRTGFAAYAILRRSGLAPDAALAALRALRPVTADEVGKDRLDLAEHQFQTWLST
ncbi:MAG: hypothetical protein AAF613_05205 [Pseudomonadota bacterium]